MTAGSVAGSTRTSSAQEEQGGGLIVACPSAGAARVGEQSHWAVGSSEAQTVVAEEEGEVETSFGPGSEGAVDVVLMGCSAVGNQSTGGRKSVHQSAWAAGPVAPIVRRMPDWLLSAAVTARLLVLAVVQ